MIAGLFLDGLLPGPESGLWAVVAAAAGAAGGRLLTAGVGHLLDTGAFADGEPAPGVADRRPARRWIEIAAILAAVGLWWWEVHARGLGPDLAAAGSIESPPATAALVRCAAHAVLCLLLAAAAWIDIRYRVIPDIVTVPGVILGLLTAWLAPDVLLPISRALPRSFAAPLPIADVLAWHGGLHTQPIPTSMGGAPHLAGLALPTIIFVVWWLICTAPFLLPAPADGFDTCASVPRRGRIEPRNLILVGGLAAISSAWWAGGPRFVGLQSALVGVAVSAGLVWAVREGASRALGREAMGLGDVTLMAMVGAWVGWQACVLAFFLAAFIGLGHGLVQWMRHRENELPYGPSLCMASVAVILGWRPIWSGAGEILSQPLSLATVLAVVVVLTALTLAVWRRLRG